MPLLALFVIVAVALVIVRIGAKALMMTGLSRDVAEFQAISCFFGVGFTTSESEMIMGNRARRKIASHLIISGNIGLTGALSTLIVTFVNSDPDWLDRLIPLDGSAAFFFKFGLILAAVLLIGVIFRLSLVQRLLDRVIESTLRRIHGVRAIDYETLLRSDDGYAVMQVELEHENCLIEKTLAEAKLGSQGVIVLGIKRIDGEYVGAPRADSVLLEGDLLTVYGKEGVIPSVCDALHEKD